MVEIGKFTDGCVTHDCSVNAFGPAFSGTVVCAVNRHGEEAKLNCAPIAGGVSGILHAFH